MKHQIDNVARMFFNKDFHLAVILYHQIEKDECQKSMEFLIELFKLSFLHYKEGREHFKPSLVEFRNYLGDGVMVTCRSVDDYLESFYKIKRFYIYEFILMFNMNNDRRIEFQFQISIDKDMTIDYIVHNSQILTHKPSFDLHIVYKNELALKKFNKLFKNI